MARAISMSIPYDYGRSFKAAAPMPQPSAGIVVPQFAAAFAYQPSSCRDGDGLVRNY